MFNRVFRPLHHNLRCFSNFSGVDNKIYELRTYNLVPSKVGQFMELSKEKFHLRTQHSVLLGYWTTELGGLNQVVHVWQYDSLSHRAKVRATLGADPVWQADYFQKILPWLQFQDNMTVRSLMEPVKTEERGGTYEMWQLGVGAGLDRVDIGQLKEALEDDNTSLSGLFRCGYGQSWDDLLMIWRHGNMDRMSQLHKRLTESDSGKKLMDGVTRKQSKILTPTAFSKGVAWQ